ncbi:MAG TPA: ATP-binding protein, partial [Steroidobacteraceae bacterium]|nr:ATP-binding protein [Steroidobacteraceae bacterium]
NFADRAKLVHAESARIEGKLLDAENLYEAAIQLARTNGSVHNEAVCNELAGRFYAARGFKRIATTYLSDARHCYLRWGADGKVRQLEQQYAHLRSDGQNSDPTTTLLERVEHLDLATVIKVSQAVSGEIVLERLIDTLLRTAVEYAGAERGLLILPRGDEHGIEAEVRTRGDEVVVELREANVTTTDLPESIHRYVLRTNETVLLSDASCENQFSADAYLLENHCRSVLCLPILKQTRLLGVLYLENNLTPHAFTPARMAILKLLASEAASSMENARLYKELAEREYRIRRMVDANIIGIAIWDFDGRIVDANDAYLQMIGYAREDLDSGCLRWKDLTPPEWLEPEERQLIPQLKATGNLAPYEKEYFRKDGSRVPVLLGLATFEEDGNQGVAFALDLTERKRSADALRELQMELAHANRLATMGQLVATIAHEVNQPIGATRNNAHAALRFLDGVPPNLVEVRDALQSVVNETYRAGNIVDRIRDQVKKAPRCREDVYLNDAVEEVVALVRVELSRNRVTARTEFAEDLPPVHADRVQLQQVMLNLILNAIEAMASVDDEVRELVISTQLSQSEGIIMAVGDSGPGIAQEDRERIFESFFTTKDQGLGIGLSICRYIVEAHGGRLWADAQQPRGAIFSFVLPAQN